MEQSVGQTVNMNHAAELDQILASYKVCVDLLFSYVRWPGLLVQTCTFSLNDKRILFSLKLQFAFLITRVLNENLPEGIFIVTASTLRKKEHYQVGQVVENLKHFF